MTKFLNVTSPLSRWSSKTFWISLDRASL